MEQVLKKVMIIKYKVNFGVDMRNKIKINIPLWEIPPDPVLAELGEYITAQARCDLMRGI